MEIPYAMIRSPARLLKYTCSFGDVIPLHKQPPARASFQMPTVRSPDDLDDVWDKLRDSHKGLPLQLRQPQKDALFWLKLGKSVLLAIGTGFTSEK